MNKISQFLKTFWARVQRFFRETPRKYLIGGGIILFIILIIIISKSRGPALGAPYIVKHDTVVQAVELAGTVEAVNNSNLGFASGGRVAHLYVHEGDKVWTGQILAQLDVGDLVAQLHSAEAGLTIAKEHASASKNNLAHVTAEENAIVASAWQTLHSDLVAVPTNVLTSNPPPIISGSYTGSIDGSYIINVYQSSASTGASFNYSGLESGTASVTTNTDVPLGTHGLFIRFPSSIPSSNYINSTWTVDVPNTRADSYANALKNYQTALETRDKVIADAQANVGVSDLSLVADAEIAQAQANVDEINAAINKSTIRAPFPGVVGSIDIHLGESAAPNTGVIKVIGADLMQIVLSVPELDIHAFNLEQKVKVAFDALSGDYTGTVSRIDPGETITSGVPVYLVDVLIDGNHEGIRSGMTARVTLDTRERANVVAVPSYLVQIGKGPALVNLKSGKNAAATPVTVGLIGTNGLTEITGGLKDGDVIVPFAS